MDSWMYRITQTLWIDELRRRRSRGNTVPLDECSQLQSAGGLEQNEASLELDKVVRAMDKLVPEQRAMLVLVCAEGLSYKETAKVLGLPVGTVMSRLSRARAQLHALVSGKEVLSAVRG
jgi:RNA polymerase sigma-70 factor (ECF subfamily)